jgi:hypothetical protein
VSTLEALDFESPTHWRWRLSDSTGIFLADHVVNVDSSAWQFEAFADLQRYLRSHAAPDRRLASEAELVAQVGDWVADRMLGPVAGVLAQRRGPVRLIFGDGSSPTGPATDGLRGLAFWPWELARVGGRTLAAQRVTFVTDLFPERSSGAKRDVGDQLRVLGVFSLPEDVGALNLRKERYALARLVHEIATVNNKAVELKVLQYGATRQRLEDLLLEEAGWDIVHLSGHGLPDGLLLETETGRRDLVSSRDLVDLLDAGAEQIKLVTLASCESAAVTANDHLRVLGLGDNAGSGVAEPRVVETAGGVAGLPVVAGALVDRLDCAVLAMRFSVVDDFAIELTGQFFSLVLVKGQPVARALGLALPRALPAAGAVSAWAPALSVGTPTLFGSRALELRLSAPEGAPLVFDADRTKLAVFLDQPERFVGRVGPMTRASAGLAPRSGRTGVVFHGMAGAGKTACALELAYTHADSFQRLVWYQGPLVETDVAAAFTGLAMALEQQVPGLEMVYLVANSELLTWFLPTLTEFFQQRRILLVLDNLEHLLTADGQWRDPRWEQFISAVTIHTGLSRVVMTSRTKPSTMPPSLLVEPVHALSLTESVLLAREWPHLRALLDAAAPDASIGGAGGTRSLPHGDASALLARTLTVLQGLPKLIELADGQAADPTALEARLDEADRVWLGTGTRLQTFLDTGEPTATDSDYLAVLAEWTRATTADLPGPAAALIDLLACLQDEDRTPFVLDAVWPDAWTALGHSGDAPPLEQALAPLLEQALITTDTALVISGADEEGGSPTAEEDASYRVHPGVADAVRAAIPSEAAAAVEDLAANLWLTVMSQALESEGKGLGQLILTAARSAIPYLARRGHWGHLHQVAETVMIRDGSPLTAAALLPLLEAAADSTKGTDDELPLGRTHATALFHLRPGEAEPLLLNLLETAITRGDHAGAAAITGDLITLYMNSGRLEDAVPLLEIQTEHTRQAGLGPWSQLANDALRLQILNAQGHSQEVLDEVTRLWARAEDLPSDGATQGGMDPFVVREFLLDAGREAATALRQWQIALDFNAAQLESKQARGATDREMAWSAFNDYGSLLGLGRLGEAHELLRVCRLVNEANDDMIPLARTIGAQAELENQLGHPDAAARIVKDALRLQYVYDPASVSISHGNLANYLEQIGAPIDQPWAHRVAATVITYQAGAAMILDQVQGLARLMATAGEARLPPTFADVCRIVGLVPGVNLADLVARLPAARAADPDTAMAEVMALARALPSSPGEDQHVKAWEPAVSALVASLHGNAEAALVLDAVLEAQAASTDWQALTEALHQVRVGIRDLDTLSGGLDELDKAILTRTLAALDGTDPVDADAWRTLTEATDHASEDDGGTGRESLARFVAIAALGDSDAVGELDSVLDEMAADPHFAPLAAAMRRILGGDRNPDTVTRELIPPFAAIATEVLDLIAMATASLPAGTDADRQDRDDSADGRD